MIICPMEYCKYNSDDICKKENIVLTLENNELVCACYQEYKEVTDESVEEEM